MLLNSPVQQLAILRDIYFKQLLPILPINQTQSVIDCVLAHDSRDRFRRGFQEVCPAGNHGGRSIPFLPDAGASLSDRS